MLAALLTAFNAPALLPQPAIGGLDGNTVIYDGTEISYHNTSTLAGLPTLPKGTRMVTMGPSSADGYDGFITFSGHLALTPGTSFYSYGKQMRRVMEIFADWMNLEHGGVDVGGKKYAVRFVWVDDRSSKTQVMNATAVAQRSSNADFVWAGYSSGLTAYTAKQANADGFLMMSGGAASTSVFTQNDMSFGLFPPAGVYTESALEGIAKAAAGIDTGTSTWPYAKRCGTGSGDCKSSIKVGFIQAAASFTRSQCSGGPGNARANGLTVATNEDGSDLMLEIPKSPTLAETVAALEQLKDAGVNVITTCTYYSTGTKLAEGLHNMTWAPYALTMSATIGTQDYADAVRGAGGFIYEYVLGYSIWHGSQPKKGDYTGLTSAEFVDRFSARFDGAKPSYHGAAQFGVGTALCKAIELAGTTSAAAVAAQLRTLKLAEFYTDISFDTNGQLAATMLVLQFASNYSKDATAEASIVYPDASKTIDIQFPMPDWPLRICWDTCNKVTGHCDESGKCLCDDGYQGANCEERVITLTDTTTTTIILAVFGALFGVLLIVGLWRLIKFMKAAVEGRRKHEAARRQRVKTAVRSAVTMQSACYLVKFDTFLEMKRLRNHEYAREKGYLKTIDNYDDLVELVSKEPVVFFSHQWLAWDDPDPDQLQYNEMVASCHAICKMKGFDINNLYIFLDYLSIPQANMNMRLAAINTLGVFSSLAQYFVVVAPDSVHKDTEQKVNKASYQRRGWCRLEQWGHMCKSGMENMYFYKDNKLVAVDDTPGDKGSDWFEESILVFEGDYTNNSNKGEMVDCVLGLYALVLMNLNSYNSDNKLGEAKLITDDGNPHFTMNEAMKKLHDLIKRLHGRTFPTEYFGDLPELLVSMLDTDDELMALAQRTLSPRVKKQSSARYSTAKVTPAP